ncbi:hypothetical protein [Alysiella filiformis]|uniref:Uncharacterized protein n=1 Tax=Alysiella filiformis DSM 16848 TaxID=1120981 RepID=A0A286E5U2_9NEIS|nr:hypothetical protein [Alysiella filiformis]QMT30332.1 hypothetical protein H3L97_06060 [Alysiella filiformis]UBQ56692.1 hypothetical protein JF568_02630 [Alysiella filiformis DSM 16848]SOD66270.1 hypothetical protein SAMN02746062_00567 [Alysiella filiformis DSM 16848]
MSENSTSNKVGVGAGAATAAGIGYAATGLSAPALTGGLAAVGSVVGGGMAAGLLVTAAAPIAVGLVVAKLFDVFSD